MSKLLSHKGYSGTCEVSVEDRCLHGRVLHIRDVISYGGDTFDELEKCFIEAVDCYLDHCKEVGKSPDKPYTGTFSIRVGPDRHKKIVDTGARLGLGLNESLNYIIDWYFDESSRVAEVIHHKSFGEAVRRFSIGSTATQEQFTRITLSQSPSFDPSLLYHAPSTTTAQ